MHCGYTMRSARTKNLCYLQCANRHVAKDACIGSFLSVAKLEQAVIQELNKLSEEYLNENDLEKQITFHDDMPARKKALETELSAYKKKRADSGRAICGLYMDKVNGIISETDFLILSRELHEEDGRLEKLIEGTQQRLDDAEQQIQHGGAGQRVLERYTDLEHLDRETVEVFIDYILVGKKDPDTKEVPVEIHWNF